MIIFYQIIFYDSFDASVKVCRKIHAIITFAVVRDMLLLAFLLEIAMVLIVRIVTLILTWKLMTKIETFLKTKACTHSKIINMICLEPNNT